MVTNIRENLDIIGLASILIIGIAGILAGYQVVLHNIGPMVGSLFGLSVLVGGGSPATAQAVADAAIQRPPTTFELGVFIVGILSILGITFYAKTGRPSAANN